MKPRQAAPVALLAAALLLTSCSTGSAPPGAGATASSPGTAPAESSPAPTTTSASPTPLPPPTQLVAVAPATVQELAANADRLYCQLGSAEGCHSYEEMQSYLTHVIAVVAPMFDQQYGVANRPAAFNYVAAGLTGPIACLKDDGTPDQFSSLDYSYCTADRAMYVGQDELWNLYKTVGSAAPAIGYAHEWGHHIQNIMGVPVPETEEQNTLLENQADCIAGAWAGFAAKSAQLDYPGDLGDLNAALAAIAVDTPEPGVPPVAPDPAALQERAGSFMKGHDNGLAACNSYFPETPVAK
jgi:predicted small secreted protein